ncbi:hypothetical protein AA0473_1982 [Acetobacter orleanensis NRIC 0473]|nr:hypothetical protein AA0473_1982 [Acetobacter orleanensis NRIC 0473]
MGGEKTAFVTVLCRLFKCFNYTYQVIDETMEQTEDLKRETMRIPLSS